VIFTHKCVNYHCYCKRLSIIFWHQRKRGKHGTDTKSGLIELLYALYATGVINHGKATVKDIAILLEQALNVNLSNYYRAIQNMRIRKINRTKFLDLLKSNLEKYMDGVDEWGKGCGPELKKCH